MSAQIDLFAAQLPLAVPVIAAAPRIKPPRELLPRRPVQWERLLERATKLDVWIQATTAWTGEILETLADPATGYCWLRKTGIVECVGEATECPEGQGRVIYMTPEEASLLHQRWPLIRVGAAGTKCVTFELAPTPDPVESDTMAMLAMLGENADG